MREPGQSDSINRRMEKNRHHLVTVVSLVLALAAIGCVLLADPDARWASALSLAVGGAILVIRTVFVEIGIRRSRTQCEITRETRLRDWLVRHLGIKVAESPDEESIPPAGDGPETRHRENSENPASYKNCVERCEQVFSLPSCPINWRRSLRRRSTALGPGICRIGVVIEVGVAAMSPSLPLAYNTNAINPTVTRPDGSAATKYPRPR